MVSLDESFGIFQKYWSFGEDDVMVFDVGFRLWVESFVWWLESLIWSFNFRV